MPAEWYFAHDDKQQGPVSWEALLELALRKRLHRTDMVWREGMKDWKKASTVEGLFLAETAIERGRRIAARNEAPRGTMAATPRTKTGRGAARNARKRACRSERWPGSSAVASPAAWRF